MHIQISDYQLKKLDAQGSHSYIKGVISLDGKTSPIEIFFRDRLEEKKLFEEAIITVDGELVESDGGLVESDGGLEMVDSRVIHVELCLEIPLDSLSVKDRLNATGLIHEFKEIFRRDKIRAKEILMVLGVSEKYSEDILLRNSYILPDRL
ncbi:MAG: hypothetical protein RIF46_04570 [Cyclobacteriaceae bacterium]